MARNTNTTTTEANNIQPMTDTTALATFNPDEFAGVEGEDLGLEIKYAPCLFLNAPMGKQKYGLFLPQNSLIQANWGGMEPNYTHTYRGEKEVTPGVLYNDETEAPRMLILRRSPRYIEVSRKGAKEGLDDIKALLSIYLPGSESIELNQSTIIHNYETPAGKEFYTTIQDTKSGLVSLRTFYLVMFVDKANNALHDFPFKLSVKGSTAASFGPAVDQMQMQGVLAYSKLSQGKTLGGSFLPLLVFEPKIVAAMVGKEDQSLACKIESFTAITQANFGSMFAGANPDTKSHAISFHDMSEGFTAKVLAGFQADGFHQLAPGVTTDDVLTLPATATFETDED
jgi:hypothetical protein